MLTFKCANLSLSFSTWFTLIPTYLKEKSTSSLSPYSRSMKILLSMFMLITPNVLQLPEGGDFEALHCQPSTNFDRSTKLDLTTEPPLLGRCCYLLAFFYPAALTWILSLMTRKGTLIKIVSLIISLTLFVERSKESITTVVPLFIR